jgi:membrane associated rhomboid family serine protease
VFGLMAVALVWSPQNEVGVAGLVFVRPVAFDAPVVTFVGLMFVWEVVQCWLVGFTVSTAVLHMAGAVVGLGVGIVFVKAKWVDCEGWDIFAVMAGEAGRERKAKKKKRKKKKPAPAPEE